MYSAYIVKVEQLRKHPNADRLLIATFYGQDVIVGTDVQIGDVGIYFPADGQLSEEFCDYNHLCNKTSTGEPDVGYIERRTRHIRAIKLRGERSYGIYCNLDSLAYTKANLDDFTPGMAINTVNDYEICKKYIPYKPYKPFNPHYAKPHIPRGNVAPLFKKHCDTAYLDYNKDKFNRGDQIEITLKMHGTSQRTAYTPVLKGYKSKYRLWQSLANLDPNKVNPKIVDWVLRARCHSDPIYEWEYISGTKRGILDTYDGGFYGSNEFRKPYAERFNGKLWKGETVYYEIVGFLPDGTPIMPSAPNNLISEDFVDKYGENTVFSYGCSPTGKEVVHGVDDEGHFTLEIEKPQGEIYVYRMTMTNEDGEVIEYPPDFMRWRCEQMGIKTVPVLWKGNLSTAPNKVFDLETNREYIMSPGEEVEEIAKECAAGPDPIGKTHIREGVVIRIINRPTFTAYKYKTFEFQLLAGYTLEEIESWANGADIDEDRLSEM